MYCRFNTSTQILQIRAVVDYTFRAQVEWRGFSVCGPGLPQQYHWLLVRVRHPQFVHRATGHIADLLSEPDARSVLAKWSGVAVGNQPPEAAALIQETGRLPLALAMIGAMLRGKPEKFRARAVAPLQG